MEKRLTKRNTGPREKTEFELMKERLNHVEFSDEEKGFLTKEQMEHITNKLSEAKRALEDLTREAKARGMTLEEYLQQFDEWKDDIELCKSIGLNIDMDGLLQARKRKIVKNLFYDPEEAERRRKAAEEALRRAKERELELERKRKLAEEERLAALEAEKNRLRREQEEKERRLREEEEARQAARRKKDEELERYAEIERKRLQLEEFKRQQSEEENRARRTGLLKKFSTTEAPDKADIDVGKLKFEMNENEHRGRRRSVGKLNNPWETGQVAAPQTKVRSRRASKVGKLNSPFEGPISETPSRVNSRGTSKAGSRRSSMGGFTETPITEQPDFMQALAGLEDLAAQAASYEE